MVLPCPKTNRFCPIVKLFVSLRGLTPETELTAAGLIAYRCPFYQVLSLEPKAAAAPAAVPEPRIGDVRSVGEILRAMMEVPR